MKRVAVEDLISGMVVGREVISQEGVALLEKGVRLTQAQIAILSRRSVSFVYIEVNEPEKQ